MRQNTEKKENPPSQNTEKTKKIRQVKTQKKSKNTEKTKKIHQVKTQKKK